MPESASWCFTISYDLFNTGPEWDPALMLYLVYQEEISETGYHHWQGAVKWKQRCGMHRCISLLKRGQCHVEAMRGPWSSNLNYCTKASTQVGTPFTFGVLPADQRESASSRTMALISEGAPVTTIIQQEPAISLRSLPNIMMARSLLQRPEGPPEIYWVWSRDRITPEWQDAFIYAEDSRWGGYLQEPRIIFYTLPSRFEDILDGRTYTTTFGHRVMRVAPTHVLFVGNEAILSHHLLLPQVYSFSFLSRAHTL